MDYIHQKTERNQNYWPRTRKKAKVPRIPWVGNSTILYAFGELDAKECSGVEANPRLTTGTLYRSSHSAMTMKRAREVLLSLSPEGFKISLSSCYNYTENYRRGSTEAKQHHFGLGVNAPSNISLRKPPRTGVEHSQCQPYPRRLPRPSFPSAFLCPRMQKLYYPNRYGTSATP